MEAAGLGPYGVATQTLAAVGRLAHVQRKGNAGQLVPQSCLRRSDCLFDSDGRHQSKLFPEQADRSWKDLGQ